MQCVCMRSILLQYNKRKVNSNGNIVSEVVFLLKCVLEIAERVILKLGMSSDLQAIAFKT